MKINKIKINTNYLIANIKYLKSKYCYNKYIVDVSNQAFYHGMYLVQYLKEVVDYFYVNNFLDVLAIRKYDTDIKIIYDGPISEDNLYDLIINNAIIVMRNMDTLNLIKDQKIKDAVSFLLAIDLEELVGIAQKTEIANYLENLNKNTRLLGVVAELKENDITEVKDIIRPIETSPLLILNHECDKEKKQGSAVKLDYSIYGINDTKKKLFQKKQRPLKQILCLSSKIICIKKQVHKNNIKYVAVIPFGYYHGMNSAITKVFIKEKLYPVFKITNQFTYLLVDDKIKEDTEVEITSENNPLENYFPNNPLNYFSLFYNNIPIIYDNYVLEKSFIY